MTKVYTCIRPCFLTLDGQTIGRTDKQNKQKDSSHVYSFIVNLKGIQILSKTSNWDVTMFVDASSHLFKMFKMVCSSISKNDLYPDNYRKIHNGLVRILPALSRMNQLPFQKLRQITSFSENKPRARNSISHYIVYML